MTYFGGIFGPLRKEAHDVGKREGIVEGELAGKQDTLLALLAAKFGEVPESARRRIASAPLETLLRWSVNVLRSDQLDQVLS